MNKFIAYIILSLLCLSAAAQDYSWRAVKMDGSRTGTASPSKDNVKEALGDRAADESAVMSLVSSEIDRLNANWPDWKRVKHIIIKKSELNKTTGMKIRRFVEENKLAD
jgi:hypothetical protein